MTYCKKQERMPSGTLSFYMTMKFPMCHDTSWRNSKLTINTLTETHFMHFRLHHEGYPLRNTSTGSLLAALMVRPRTVRIAMTMTNNPTKTYRLKDCEIR